MMNQQPDKLFRDKLENYQRPAPAPAWDRIEAGLDKKNKFASPWLKIAAALLLVAMAVWIFWPKNATLDTIPQTADHKKDEPKISPSRPMEKPPVEKQQAVVEPTENKVNEKNTTAKNNAPNKKVISAPIGDEKKVVMEKNPVLLKAEATTPQDVAAIEKSTTQETVVAKNNSSESESNIKIVLTANDAEKYLVKSSPDEATSDVKKPSRLQKLLDKADDLTTNQDPIGEIRQVKNEILALNFRSEKDRGQNK